MSFSVGAALKKVAVSLLTDKKVLKWAGGIVLGALIIIMIPFAVIISLGSGQIKIDTEGLKAAVQAELNEVDLAFQNISQGTKIKPLRIDDAMFTAAFKYYLSRQHWMDASIPPLEQRLNEFVSELLAD